MSTGAVIKEAALTPWFSGDVKPVRDGAYERQIGNGATAYWRWNSSGPFWEYGGSTDLSECSGSCQPSYDQDLPWRGLAANPAGGAK